MIFHKNIEERADDLNLTSAVEGGTPGPAAVVSFSNDEYVSILERRSQSRLIMVGVLVCFIIVMASFISTQWIPINSIAKAPTQSDLNLQYNVSLQFGDKVISPLKTATDLEKAVATAAAEASPLFGSSLTEEEFKLIVAKEPVIMLNYAAGKTIKDIQILSIVVPVTDATFPNGTLILKTSSGYVISYDKNLNPEDFFKYMF